MRLTSILRMTTPPKVNPIALTGFGAGNDFYDRTRPTYPRAALEAVRDAVKGQNILEIGSGTVSYLLFNFLCPLAHPRVRGDGSSSSSSLRRVPELTTTREYS